MIALTRFGFFVFAWSILFFTSLLVSSTHKDTSIFYEKFAGIVFFSTSLLLLVWIYVSQKDVTASKDLFKIAQEFKEKVDKLRTMNPEEHKKRLEDLKKNYEVLNKNR